MTNRKKLESLQEKLFTLSLGHFVLSGGHTPVDACIRLVKTTTPTSSDQAYKWFVDKSISIPKDPSHP